MNENRNSLTTNRVSGPPAPAHYALAGWLAHAITSADNGKLSALTLPSGPRSGLESRRDALRDCLAPCPKARIAGLLASLGGMASRAQADPDTAKALAIQSLDDLSDVSEWALGEAVKAFRLGQIGDGRWRPTVGELRIEARKREAPHREELWKLGRVLDNPAIDASPIKLIGKDRFAELQALVSGVTPKENDDV